MPLASPDTTATSAVGELATEREGEVAARPGGVAGADDADAAAVEDLPAPPGEQDGRRLRVGTEQQRIVGIALAHGADAELGAPSGPGVRIALGTPHGAMPQRSSGVSIGATAGCGGLTPARHRPGLGRVVAGQEHAQPRHRRQVQAGQRGQVAGVGGRRPSRRPPFGDRLDPPRRAGRARQRQRQRRRRRAHPVVVACGEVGDGAGDPADAVIPPSGEPVVLDLAAQQRPGAGDERGDLVELAVTEARR